MKPFLPKPFYCKFTSDNPDVHEDLRRVFALTRKPLYLDSGCNLSYVELPYNKVSIAKLAKVISEQSSAGRKVYLELKFGAQSAEFSSCSHRTKVDLEIAIATILRALDSTTYSTNILVV